MARKRAGNDTPKPRKPRVRWSDVKSISFETWVKRLRALHNGTAPDSSGAADGACLYRDPRTGQRLCTETSPDVCTALKGRFIGGPCGGAK